MEEHLSQEPQLTDFHPDDVVDETVIPEAIPPITEAAQPEEAVGLTFSDGFQFGCGFALALTLAVVLVVFGILLLSLLFSILGINILHSLLGFALIA